MKVQCCLAPDAAILKRFDQARGSDNAVLELTIDQSNDDPSQNGENRLKVFVCYF